MTPKRPLYLTIWFFAAGVLTLLALLLISEYGLRLATGVPLILMWATVLLRIFHRRLPILAWRQRFPGLFWLLWLLGFAAVFVFWLILFQPSLATSWQSLEVFYLLSCIYWLIFFFSTGLNRAELQFMLEKSGIGSGFVLMLASIIIVIFSIELGMRYIWVYSDSFAFSRMHQTWMDVYWKPLNSLSYRDNEPPASADSRTHIIVAGDSLASGYGVNDINDTFPHLLQKKLGDDYTTNIVAQPGWGISTAMHFVQEYPVAPDILILSHYLNDIIEGDAKNQYGVPFPQLRITPDPALAWWIDTFYIPNFFFYRLYHYSSGDAAGKYNRYTLAAYDNPAVWAAYEQELQAVIDWTAAHHIRLIVLVWCNLLDADDSRRYTIPVVEYFHTRDIPVVDMTAILANEPASKLVVNPYDSHPSVYSHTQAATALFTIVRKGDLDE